MGLHSDATGMHLEMIARNEYEPGRADVLGFAPDDTQIAPHLPSHLKSTLWPTLDLEQFFINHSALVSYNAGGYLCNFIYFEALARFPSKKIGFLHVPSDAAIPICTQQLALQALLQEIQAVA
jgi:pyrrolidone-carboxylate peptidase